MTNEHSFNCAVQKYKNVTTHYVAAKMEIWMALFMKPVYGVTHLCAVKEFSSGRGTAHFHSLLYTDKNKESEKLMDECLSELSLELVEYLQKLDSFINEHYTQSNDFPIHPHGISNPKEGLKSREAFCKTIPNGDNRFNSFITEQKQILSKYESTLTDIIETEWGYSAMHPGQFPQHWVKPGRAKKEALSIHDSTSSVMNYRPTSDRMISSTTVINTKELKKLKCMGENDLLIRVVNIVNHCGVHKCSSYCLRTKKISTKFDENLHHNIDDSNVFTNPDGTNMVKMEYQECRMGFGIPLKFDSSGENNKTYGIKPEHHGGIAFNNNGHPKFIARRNHPRILQQPFSFLFWGANNDLQRLLVNRTTFKKIKERGMSYFHFLTCLQIIHKIGLEQFSGSYIVEQYITKYVSKGSFGSTNWDYCLKTIAENYCKDDNESKTLRSMVAKHMNSIFKLESKSCDEAIFTLSGGLLTRNSYTPRKL